MLSLTPQQMSALEADALSVDALLRIDLPSGTKRWTSLPSDYTDTSGRKYLSDNPMLDIPRLPDRDGGPNTSAFALPIADADASTFASLLANGWIGRTVTLDLLVSGVLLHGFVGQLDGATAQDGITSLQCAGELSKLDSTRVRSTTDNSQRAVASADDSMKYAQSEARIVWGAHIR